MQVTWQKCGDDGHWCSLENLSLDSIGDSNGVYIIWHTGNPSKVVRIGQGSPIKDRLSAHRNDPKILVYKKYGKLLVTWAEVSLLSRDGVERYLGDIWNPLVGSVFPDASPVVVNSPWK
jgi:hypothetical protein